MSFNKIILVGNLGRDPELRYTPQGAAVCSFTMATNERRRDKSGEYNDVTTWFRVTIWRERAETAHKYLKKGSSVYIEGRLRIEEWTDRDNNLRYTLDVQATEMQFIGGGSGGGRDSGEYSGPDDHEPQYSGSAPPNNFGAASSSAGAQSAPSTASSDDDIPF